MPGALELVAWTRGLECTRSPLLNLMRNEGGTKSRLGRVIGQPGVRGVHGLSSGTDWPTLLKDYQTAVKNFESVSSALTAALSAGYPLDADFLALVTAEERTRETVILARMR